MFKEIKAAALILLFAGSCGIQASDWRSQIDLSNADLTTFNMVLIHKGEVAGSMTYGWLRQGDTYVVADYTEMQPNITETAKGVLDAKTLLPHSVTIDFAMGAARMDIDLVWEGGNRTGQFVTTRGSKEKRKDVSVTEETAAPLRMAVIGMVAAFPLATGFETSLPWYNTMANKMETVTLKTVGSEAVETPSGKYETYKVSLSGGETENIFYISKKLPRKIVRIDVVGQQMHFLRTD